MIGRASLAQLAAGGYASLTDNQKRIGCAKEHCMKFGAQVGCYSATWDEIRSVVGTIESGRWYSVYLADHFLPPNHGDASEFKRFEEEVITTFA